MQDAIRAGVSEPNSLCPLVDAKGTPTSHALGELYRCAAPAHRTEHGICMLLSSIDGRMLRSLLQKCHRRSRGSRVDAELV